MGPYSVGPLMDGAEPNGAAQRARDEVTPRDREGFYRVLYGRRDIRSQFLPDPIPDEVLVAVLRAAHHAPSVGFMQPWNFVVVRDRAIREKVRANFEEVRREGAAQFSGERRSLYDSLKLEGILDAPVNICVTCDPDRAGKAVLGRVRVREVDVFSTCLAIENLWLAARAEGLGVGWVSILDPERVRDLLEIPVGISPLAYLTMGYVREFPRRPELETKGWATRAPLDGRIFLDRWGARYPSPLDTPPVATTDR